MRYTKHGENTLKVAECLKTTHSWNMSFIPEKTTSHPHSLAKKYKMAMA
ncbi:MAG TPA: hypothetical protein VNQ57_06275 [Ureibacillus sp.]|nr:hypothetical protein [Ureibacillus sp.]